MSNTIKKIKEERKRYSLPIVNLTFIESEVLKGIVQGRKVNELNSAIKMISINDSYYGVIKRLMKKFEANSLAQVVYKACNTIFL